MDAPRIRRSRKDCRELIRNNGLPFVIRNIGQVARLVNTSTGGSMPIISWQWMFDYLTMEIASGKYPKTPAEPKDS
jgi:hypothetical protein